MKHIRRTLEAHLKKAAKAFPAIVLTGPRRAGKTWMIRRLFSKAGYFLLEDPDIIARVRMDPQGFLDSIELPVILDEIQHVPELFAYIRSRIDDHPHQMGQWIITGSQEVSLMRGVSESMAGRAAIIQLLPFSIEETEKVSVLLGGYPEVLARPHNAHLWFASYLQTYLERDVRSIISVRDLSTFRRFLALVASRHGQILNKTDFASPLGVSVPTITQWIGVLEATEQILVVPPFYENLGKRLTKSPKIYFMDSGLACHLLGIESPAELAKSPFSGALFEGFVAAEIVKHQLHNGQRRELYFFRDEQGLEVDFLLPQKNGGMALVECKSGRTVTPTMAAPMLRLAGALRKRRPEGTKIHRFIAYQPSRKGGLISTLAPGVTAVSCFKLLDMISG